MKIPKKVQDRTTKNLKNFQTIAEAHKKRDVSEADTVTLVKDIMADILGFDKYEELTSEQQIRGTFCDLAVKINGKIKYLVEVKAAGIDLNEAHLRQALNYGANEGIEWVVLTNSIDWRLYRIKFSQPIEHEEVTRLNLLEINPKIEEDIKHIFLLSREGLDADAMGEYHQHTQILNKFTIAQLLGSDHILSAIRKDMRKLFPELKVDLSDISDMLRNDILKREVVEGDKVKEAETIIKKAANKLNKRAEKQKSQQQKNTTNKKTTVPMYN